MKPLAGISVVNCRPRTQSAALNSALRSAGANPISMPLLEVVAPRDGGGALNDALAQLDNFDWVLFTSTNAVDAVVNALGVQRSDLPRVGSVGVATTRRLRDSGIEVHFTSEHSTAADLGESLPLELGQRILTPLGDRASSALEDALTARGAKPTRVEAYRTLWTDPADEARRQAMNADFVFLTSPAIAERFSQLIEAGPRAVCIGPTTAEAANRLGLDVAAVATNRGPDGLITALVNTIS